MIKIGKGTTIKGVKIIGKGDLIIGDNVRFGKGIVINVSERLEIGDRGIIGDFFDFAGRWIQIGREFWSGRLCAIGGGSCFEKRSKLEWGDFGHLGDFSFINTARPVRIGDEVGLGQDTRVYTHGAYQSFLRGFPVKFGPVNIGNNVWCPKAIIMPDVRIDDNTVVGAGAIVTKSLPAGCLAMGAPAKVIREDCYPKKYLKSEIENMIRDFISHFQVLVDSPKVWKINQIGNRVFVDGTLFDLGDLRINGSVTELTEKFKNELRRYGVRFRFYAKNGVYVPWQ